MHLKLVPSTLEDLASYVVIGNSAFERDGLRLLMFPPERFDPRDPYAESRFRVIRTLKRAKDPQVRHLHVVDVDAEEDVSSLGDFTKEITEKIGQFEGEFGGVVEGFGEDHGKDKEVVGQEGKRKNGRARLVGESVWIAPAAVDEREQKDAEGPAEKGEMVGGVEKPKDDDSHLPNSLSKEVLEEVKEKLEIERKRVMGDRKDYWCKCRIYTARHLLRIRKGSDWSPCR